MAEGSTVLAKVDGKQLTALSGDRPHSSRVRRHKCSDECDAAPCLPCRTLPSSPHHGPLLIVCQYLEYLRDIVRGQAKLLALDSARYPELQWTTVRAFLEPVIDRSRLLCAALHSTL